MRAAPSQPVVLFTQDGCPDSARVRACFRASCVPFVEHNVSHDHDAALALAETGVFAAPVAVANGGMVFGARSPRPAAVHAFVCRCLT